jgi:hypothetical protein
MAYNRLVRFKSGLIVGLAVGYYYGAKAGRERYQQIDHYLAQVRASDAYQDLRARLDQVVDQSVGRARNAVNDAAFGGHSPTSTRRSMPSDYTGDPTLN